MDFVTTMASNLLASGLLALVVKWLLDRSETRSEAVFKAALGKQAFEHQTVYPRLYEKSLEVVTESHVLLSRFSQAVVIYTSLFRLAGEPSDDERLPKVVDAFDAFKDYFYGHRIFIPKQAADAIDAQVKVIVGTANVYKVMVHKHNKDLVDWTRINQKIDEEMLPAIAELEKTYRTLVRIEAMFPGFELPANQQGAAVLGRANG